MRNSRSAIIASDFLLIAPSDYDDNHDDDPNISLYALTGI